MCCVNHYNKKVNYKSYLYSCGAFIDIFPNQIECFVVFFHVFLGSIFDPWRDSSRKQQRLWFIICKLGKKAFYYFQGSLKKKKKRTSLSSSLSFNKPLVYAVDRISSSDSWKPISIMRSASSKHTCLQIIGTQITLEMMK